MLVWTEIFLILKPCLQNSRVHIDHALGLLLVFLPSCDFSHALTYIPLVSQHHHSLPASHSLPATLPHSTLLTPASL